MGRSPVKSCPIPIGFAGLFIFGSASVLELADHDYRVVRPGTGKLGNVLLRARGATVLSFGLDLFPELPTAYTRQGGKQIGKLQTSPRKVCWQTYRIATSPLYPSGCGHVAWSFALSANHRTYDFIAIARAIEASGADWIGIHTKTNAKYLSRGFLLSQTAANV